MKDEKRNQDRWWQCPSINHLRTQSLLCPVMRGCCQDQKNIIKPNFLNPIFHPLINPAVQRKRQMN